MIFDTIWMVLATVFQIFLRIVFFNDRIGMRVGEGSGGGGCRDVGQVSVFVTSTCVLNVRMKLRFERQMYSKPVCNYC